MIESGANRARGETLAEVGDCYGFDLVTRTTHAPATMGGDPASARRPLVHLVVECV